MLFDVAYYLTALQTCIWYMPHSMHSVRARTLWRMGSAVMASARSPKKELRWGTSSRTVVWLSDAQVGTMVHVDARRIFSLLCVVVDDDDWQWNMYACKFIIGCCVDWTFRKVDISLLFIGEHKCQRHRQSGCGVFILIIYYTCQSSADMHNCMLRVDVWCESYLNDPHQLWDHRWSSALCRSTM